MLTWLMTSLLQDLRINFECLYSISYQNFTYMPRDNGWVKQWVLQKPSEKGVDRGEIVHHRHGTVWIASSGKSEQILNNRQKKWKFCCQKQPWLKRKKEETWFRVHLQSATPKSPTCAQTARWSTTETRPSQTSYSLIFLFQSFFPFPVFLDSAQWALNFL